MVTTRARLVVFYKVQHMHVVLQRENGLRTTRLLSHCSSAQHRLMLIHHRQ
jgi:hypothetical protein